MSAAASCARSEPWSSASVTSTADRAAPATDVSCREVRHRKTELSPFSALASDRLRSRAAEQGHFYGGPPPPPPQTEWEAAAARRERIVREEVERRLIEEKVFRELALARARLHGGLRLEPFFMPEGSEWGAGCGGVDGTAAGDGRKKPQLISLQRGRQRRRRQARDRNRLVSSAGKRKGSPCQEDEDLYSQAGKRTRRAVPALPEDIWCHIHSLLPMRDAARVACQSRSFLRSWRCHPVLTLNSIILGSNGNACSQDFICKADRILSNHSGIGIKIFNLRLFSIFDACPYLDRWLQIAVKPGIEELTLELCCRCERKCTIPCSLLSEGVQNSIRYLRLASCSFRPTAELAPLKNLTSLSLHLVKISWEELECFLSNSLALERLDLSNCNEIVKLKIPHVMQQLSCLDVSYCSELLVIESEARNLSKFSYSGGGLRKVSLGETLQMRSFSMYRPKLLCYARTKMPACMPNLEALDIGSSYEMIDTPMLPTKFMFLKHLRIHLIPDCSFCPSYDYFSLASFLDASPLLETLILDVEQYLMKHKSVFGGSGQLRQMPDHRHGCLKTVKITGFSSAKGLIELTCYIVKNAESLECLTLDTLTRTTNRCYLEDTILDECSPMSEAILKEAPRAVKAIRTYIEDKVPSTVKLTVLEPCSRCHANGGFQV